MLKELRIKNLARIGALSVGFNEGLNVLTGETGAGKSILVDALELLVGARAEGSLVREGAERAELAAEFDVAAGSPPAAWLAERELEGAPGGLILRRTLDRAGRSRCFINGHAATLAQLREAGPADHPLIVHIADIFHLHYWAQAIPDSAWQLASHFWPGPLTLILQRSRRIPDSVTGGQDTAGLRIPAHPVALALLGALGPENALAAPSANRFGRISPTTAAHVREELGAAVDMILDGGACDVGLESTIISFHDQSPMILRPGGIAASALESVLEGPVILAHNTSQIIRTSGSLPAHYAPATPLRIYSTELIWDRTLALAAQGLRVLVMTCSDIMATRTPSSKHALSATPTEYVYTKPQHQNH